MYKNIHDISKDVVKERNRLVIKTKQGDFFKPCPGTGDGYYCCGYQIVTPLTGCGMYCSYCVLQEYHEEQCQVEYDNYSDLENEVKFKLAEEKNVVRIGTGEFADSLYLEKKLGLSQKIAHLLEPYPNVLVEFKTKSTNIEPLNSIKDPSKVVIGFSMNTPYMVSQVEKGTATIEKRLKAAKLCVDMGFWVAFHFDPMIWYPQWKSEYCQVVDQIFNTISDPKRIAWWSMGGFRTLPSLKSTLRFYKRNLPLFSGEMILGDDKKLRYFRPVRVAFYKAMQDQIELYYSDTTLYLCMESREVWEECGMIKRIPRGLTSYLDERAEKMLGYKQENN